jgi:hypothetical protein
LIEPYSPESRKQKAAGGTGTDAAHVNGFNLADEACEEALYEVPLFREFCQNAMLYATAILSIQEGNLPEGQEFYRQALIQNPECETCRREYHRLFGEFYRNPLS